MDLGKSLNHTLNGHVKFLIDQPNLWPIIEVVNSSVWRLVMASVNHSINNSVKLVICVPVWRIVKKKMVNYN